MILMTKPDNIRDGVTIGRLGSEDGDIIALPVSEDRTAWGRLADEAIAGAGYRRLTPWVCAQEVGNWLVTFVEPWWTVDLSVADERLLNDSLGWTAVLRLDPDARTAVLTARMASDRSEPTDEYLGDVVALQLPDGLTRDALVTALWRRSDLLDGLAATGNGSDDRVLAVEAIRVWATADLPGAAEGSLCDARTWLADLDVEELTEATTPEALADLARAISEDAWLLDRTVVQVEDLIDALTERREAGEE